MATKNTNSARFKPKGGAKKGASDSSGARKKAPKAVKRAGGGKDLLLRGVDPDVLEALRERADRSGRSLQQELHLALRRDAKRNFDEAVQVSKAWHARLEGRAFADSADLVREDRGR